MFRTSQTSLPGADALPACAPAVPIQDALGATGQFPGHLHDCERVRSAVRAYLEDVANPADFDLLFSRRGGQSIAHWAVANGQSDILIAIATPLAMQQTHEFHRMALCGVLMGCDTTPARCSPAHWAGLYGRLGMLRLYADVRLGLSGALLEEDAEGNNPAHYWVSGGRDLEELAGLADTMRLGAGHPLRQALTQPNAHGLQPGDMSARERSAPDARSAGAGASAPGLAP